MVHVAKCHFCAWWYIAIWIDLHWDVLHIHIPGVQDLLHAWVYTARLHHTCSCVTMLSVFCAYFLLNAEGCRWQWTSFLAGASTAGYVCMYSFYYYFKTKMYGLFQTTFYFGYMAVFSLALGIVWNGGLCWHANVCLEDLLHSDDRLDRQWAANSQLWLDMFSCRQLSHRTNTDWLMAQQLQVTDISAQ